MPVRGEETAGTDVRAVAKRHHVVRNGRHLGPGEIAGFAHAREAAGLLSCYCKTRKEKKKKQYFGLQMKARG
jgi:hypothetical protein